MVSESLPEEEFIWDAHRPHGARGGGEAVLRAAQPGALPPRAALAGAGRPVVQRGAPAARSDACWVACCCCWRARLASAFGPCIECVMPGPEKCPACAVAAIGGFPWLCD